MILAAADAAEHSEPPPESLVQAWQVKRWRALPESGGLRDQRVGELERMTALSNVYDAVRGFNLAKDKGKWAEEHPGLDRVLAYVMELWMERDR